MGDAAKKLNDVNGATAVAKAPLQLLRRPIAVLRNNHTLWHWTIPLVTLMSFTVDRTIHFLWAGAFWLVGVLLLQALAKISSWTTFTKEIAIHLTSVPGVPRWHCISMNLYVIYLGSWLPDIDWMFNLHRSPITHSALPFQAMLSLARSYGWKFGNADWNWRLLFVFGYALSSHLITDIIPGGNVVSLPAWLDMPFLFVNGAVVFGFTMWLQRIHFRTAKVAPF